MGRDLSAITGIGPTTAQALKLHGFQRVDDVATASVAALASVPGFGALRSARVIAAASALLGAAPGDAGLVATVNASESTDKQDKSRKDKAKAKKAKAKKGKGKKAKKAKKGKGKGKKSGGKSAKSSGKKSKRDRKGAKAGKRKR